MLWRRLDALQGKPDSNPALIFWLPEDLKRAINLNCRFSIGPAMLVSDRGRARAMRMPKNRVLTETDGPFAQIRDETLFPWHAQDAVESMSHVWNTPIMEVEAQLRQNLARTTQAL